MKVSATDGIGHAEKTLTLHALLLDARSPSASELMTVPSMPIMSRGDAVGALGRDRHAAEDVAAADDDGDLDAGLRGVGDLARPWR